MKDYIDINRKSWDLRLEAHLESDFYDLKGFLQGKSSLNSIELDLLGDVENKRIAHLQCHFGLDSMSLARLGAKVTGVDFSEPAILKAREIASKLELDAEFVLANVLELPSKLDHKFDLVFSSYGTIGWFPDLISWAKNIRKCLQPGGQLLLVDFHPALWMLDDGFSHLHYSYFKTDPIVSIEGTYTENGKAIRSKNIGWNHSFNELFLALHSEGFQLNNFKEFNYSPYNCFPNMVKTESGYQFSKFKGNLPYVYAIEMQLNDVQN